MVSSTYFYALICLDKFIPSLVSSFWIPSVQFSTCSSSVLKSSTKTRIREWILCLSYSYILLVGWNWTLPSLFLLVHLSALICFHCLSTLKSFHFAQYISPFHPSFWPIGSPFLNLVYSHIFSLQNPHKCKWHHSHFTFLNIWSQNIMD